MIILIASCQNKNNKGIEPKNILDTINSTKIEKTSKQIRSANASNVNYQKETTDTITANRIIKFLREKYKEDLTILTSTDRTFSFYQIDLNDDGKNEYFISLLGRYFYGSGGCSFYLLNSDFTVNTYFSVTNPPIFISSQKTDGWHDLILKGSYDENGGVISFIQLKFDKTKEAYPSNPSLIKKTKIAPSGEDFIMWDDNFSRAKSFVF